MEFLGTDLRLGGAAGPSAFKPRVNSQASAASITPDIAAYDGYVLSAQAVGLTVFDPTGTPYDLQVLRMTLRGDGTARNIIWAGSKWRAVDKTLPGSVPATDMLFLEFVYSSAHDFWFLASQKTIAYTAGITVLGLYVQANGGTINFSTAFPGITLQAGDYVIFAGANNSSGGNFPSATGYTSIQTTNNNDTSGYSNTALSYKKMTGTPDTSITTSGGSANGGGEGVGIMLVRGVDGSTPVDGFGVQGSGQNTGVVNPSPATPSLPGGLSVVVGGNLSHTVAFSAPDLDAFLDVGDLGSVGNNCRFGMGYRKNAGTTTFDPGSWGGATGTSFCWTSVHAILRAA